MPNLDTSQRRIDVKTAGGAGGGSIIETGGTVAGNPVVAPPPPTALTVTSTALGRSAVTPTAIANLSWIAPARTAIASYVLQAARDSGFTQIVRSLEVPGDKVAASVDGLPTGETIYFRMATIAVGGLQGRWSSVVSAPMDVDSTAPGPATSVTVAFAADGTLEVRATPPTSTNFKHIRVEVRNAADTVELDRSQFGGGLWTWSPARNKQQTAAAGGSGWTTSVVVRVYAVSWGNVDSTVVSTAASSTAPSAPTGLGHSWSGSPTTAGADLLVTHTVVAGLSYYLSIDSLERPIPAGRYLYAFTQNLLEHSSTPDPVLSLSLVAENQIGQRSTAATATATNAAPPATTLTVFPGPSMMGLTITPSAALDFKRYRVRAYKAAVLVDTVCFTDPNPTYTVSAGTGSYQFDVAVEDVFGQTGTASSLTAAVSATDWATYVADLRSGLLYFDDQGTAATTLSGLKDGNTATDVVAYGAGSTWKKTTGDWQQEITHRITEVSAGNDINAIIAVSSDLVTWTYYYGGTPSGGLWQPASSTTTEATALAGAITLTGGTVWKIQLPSPKLCRYIRLYSRRAAGTYALREFFPSTLLRGTYVEAESLTAREIAVGSLSGDRLVATAIDGFTITGSIIRTAASGARIQLSGSTLAAIDSGGVTRVAVTPDGLKTYNSAGDVVVEATTATNGALKAGIGAVTLDRDGLSLAMQAGAGGTTGTLRFVSSLNPSVSTAGFTTWESAIQLFNRLKLETNTTQAVDIQIDSWQKGAATARTTLEARSGDVGGTGLVPEYTVRLQLQASSSVQRATISGAPLYVESQLNAYSLATGVTKRLLVAYDDTNDRGVLQAIHDSVAFKTLVIQPSGGDVILGSASNTIGLNGSTIGAAGALAGYLIVTINGTARKIPYYATS